MGLPTTRFVSSVDQALFCPICNDVLEDPVQGKCGHVYCNECQLRDEFWTTNGRYCPVSAIPGNERFFDAQYFDGLNESAIPEEACRQGTTVLAKPLQSILGSLKIKCKNNLEDHQICSWVGRLSELKNHEAHCVSEVIRKQIEEKYQEIRRLKRELIRMESELE